MVDGFKNDVSAPRRKLPRKIILIAAAIAVIILCVRLGGLFLKYIEVREIGGQYAEVFVKNLALGISVKTIGFFIIFAFSVGNVFVIRKNLRMLNLKRGIFERRLFSVLVSLAVSLLLETIVSDTLGEKLLVFLNACFFGKTDPVFGKDIGYYLFQRPFLTAVCSTAFNVWLFMSCAAAAAYWFFGTVSGGYKSCEMFSFRSIAFHNCVNICILILIYCISYIFKAENILYGSFGELRGAGFTDKHIWLAGSRVAPFLIAAITAVSIFLMRKGKRRAAVKTVLVYPAFWLLTGIAAFAVQTVVVLPNEVIRENESISQNIEFTQAAYGLDDISEVEFRVNNNLTAEDVKNNASVTDNIRILDLSANLTVLNQIQGIRNYYQFYETDIVPYEVGGKKGAVAVTAREITKENLSDSADTYINRKLRYTHGFGVVMNEINRVSPQGQPEFLIKDIPPKSAEGIRKIKQPRIYYGELTDDYVIVGSDKYKELDYSEGQDDVEFAYDGTGGLKMNFFNRLLFAARYGDIRLLISDLVSADSRILINRDIMERLKIAVPFLKYDTDPYIVIDSDGSLKWIADAYTTSDAYPFAQSSGEFNYIRNSVKAVIDAYCGDIKLYVSDKNDPIIQMYSAAYPNLFEKEDIPEGIRGYIKYPEYLFKVQSDIYGKYHISNPKTFYNKNDMWVVAKERYGAATEEKDIVPYYNMMRLDGETEGELLLTIPYTLANKDNMVSWFAVRNEWANYGKLQVYKFPKDINVYGPMQIENRINSDADISKELNLWSQGGSKVIRGNMIVVPINNSILYVEPIYIASSNKSALPELKQVAVAYNETIVMRNSLNGALYALFGENAPDETEPKYSSADKSEYNNAAKRVIDEFRRLQQSSSENDWSAFGESMTALEESVDELEKSLE